MSNSMSDKGYAISYIVALALVLGAIVFGASKGCDNNYRLQKACIERGGIWVNGSDQCLPNGVAR